MSMHMEIPSAEKLVSEFTKGSITPRLSQFKEKLEENYQALTSEMDVQRAEKIAGIVNHIRIIPKRYLIKNQAELLLDKLKNVKQEDAKKFSEIIQAIDEALSHTLKNPPEDITQLLEEYENIRNFVNRAEEKKVLMPNTSNLLEKIGKKFKNRNDAINQIPEEMEKKIPQYNSWRQASKFNFGSPHVISNQNKSMKALINDEKAAMLPQGVIVHERNGTGKFQPYVSSGFTPCIPIIIYGENAAGEHVRMITHLDPSDDKKRVPTILSEMLALESWKDLKIEFVSNTLKPELGKEFHEALSHTAVSADEHGVLQFELKKEEPKDNLITKNMVKQDKFHNTFNVLYTNKLTQATDLELDVPSSEDEDIKSVMNIQSEDFIRVYSPLQDNRKEKEDSYLGEPIDTNQIDMNKSIGGNYKTNKRFDQPHTKVALKQEEAQLQSLVEFTQDLQPMKGKVDDDWNHELISLADDKAPTVTHTTFNLLQKHFNEAKSKNNNNEINEEDKAKHVEAFLQKNNKIPPNDQEAIKKHFKFN